MDKRRRRGGATRGAATHGPAAAPILIAFALLALGPRSAAQTGSIPLSVPPAEAPKSIFAAKLGEGPGAEAEILVKGSWEASLLSSLSLPFGGSAAPSFQPLLFTQRPDLFLAFVLFDRVFVEARITEDLSQARYAAGYRGGEGEALAEARIGNDGISFPAMPFLSLGGGSYRSFGAKASAKAGRFEGAAMIRYDQADRVTKRFAGGASVEEKTLPATGYIKGRWFVASRAPIAGLELFARSSGGPETGSDGFSYRRLDAGEYSFAAATGAIALGAASATRVLAAYDGAPAELTVAGRACEILFDPAAEDGSADPRRQVLSRYAATVSARGEAYVRDSSSGQRDLDFEVRVDPAGYLEVLRADGADRPRPFESLMPWIYRNDYSVAAVRDYAAAPTREIVVREYGSPSVMAIDQDAIAGSVELRRNGAPEYAFSLDARTGAITLASPAGMTELIEVSYLRESAERRSGSIAAALGGTWAFDGGRAAWAALGTRWAVPGVGYASGEGSNPGTVVLTAGEKDSEGALTHRAALAASYGRDEATGRYRIDGMEGSSSSLASTFRPEALSASDYSAREASEGKLAEAFPSLVASTHPDGSAQRALRIEAGDAASGAFYKIEGTIPHASFGTFAFCARVEGGFSSRAALTLAIDDGTSAAVAVTLEQGAIDEGWRRYYLRYGQNSASVVARESEDGPELVLGASATGSANPSAATAARLRVVVEGLEKGAALWIDEVTLEESTGRAAIVFQGAAAYSNPSLSLGPVLSGLSASADASAALREEAYATGGASLSTRLGFAALTARARGGAAAGASPYLRGGHDIAVPTFSFPAAASESFDFDPATGAFGREDKLSLKAADALAIDAAQRTLWTPPPNPAEPGLLEQSWSFGLAAAKGTVKLAAGVSNAARPGSAPATPGDYASAWKESFKYYLPALESESAKREARVSAALKAGALGEVAKASLASIAEPRAAGGAARRNEASLRMGFQLKAGGIAFAPYYARAWKERLDGAAGSLAGDAANVVGDFSGYGNVFTSPPFAELAGEGTRELFAGATERSGEDGEEASYAPEAGIVISRPFGSYWWDLVAPSSFSLAYARNLSRQADSVRDAGTWTAAAKSAAVNLFGRDGAYPLGLPFDGDEYLASVRAKVSRVEGESATRYAVDAQHLAGFSSGVSDRLDAESRFAAAREPGKLSWSESLRAAVSARRESHWMLDLYRALLPGEGGSAGPGPAGPGEGTVFSSYFAELAAARPVLREGASIALSVQKAETDEERYAAAWKLEEAYEAKLTLPQKLTATLSVSLSQAWGGGKPFTAGAGLGAKVVASF